MDTRTSEYKQITKFLQKYSIVEHSEGATVIASQNNTYLIRNIEITNSSGRQKNEQLNEIINTLSQHQTFTSKNILSLIDFQIIFNKSKTESQIRAVYEYGQKSLAKQIQERKQSQQHFDQDALWGLLYSITSPLAYLQQKNIIYGVIDPSRVFLDKNIIAILDPSSTGIDPYEVDSNRLYSPQLLKQDRCLDDIDMFKSDVFTLGLLMLQCALLKIQLYEYDENVISICLSQIKDFYSQNFCQLIESMLDFDYQTRPSFPQILKSISNLFDISTSQVQTLEPLCPDRENECNQICEIDEFSEKQNIDILETEYVRFQDYRHPSDFQKAQVRFCSSKDQRLSQSPIQQGSEYSQTSSLFIQDSMVKSFEKSRRIYKPKQIKDKLIKKDLVYHSERDNLEFDQNRFHRRTKTNWQQNEHLSQKQRSYTNRRNQNDISSKQARFNQNKKQNFFTQNNQSSYCSSSSTLNKENLFTKPEIMNMIKNDIKRIQQRNNSTLNINSHYFANLNHRDQSNFMKKQNNQQALTSTHFRTHSMHHVHANSDRRC